MCIMYIGNIYDYVKKIVLQNFRNNYLMMSFIIYYNRGSSNDLYFNVISKKKCNKTFIVTNDFSCHLAHKLFQWTLHFQTKRLN